jgi:SAM-dependent methyltransferase
MSRSTGKNRRKKGKKRSGGRAVVSHLNAGNADKHLLYQQSVQDAETAIDFIDEIFSNTAGRHPLSFREDFCGTAFLAAAFAARSESRTAAGIDLDKETLDWGLSHNIVPLPDISGRVTLVHGDVLDGTPGSKFDVVAAFNFSYWVFKERKKLLNYFVSVKDSLNDSGLFLMDLHGGPDAQFQMEEATAHDDFDYVWEQESFDPITHSTLCHIHFKFQDGSSLKKAFTYDWRFWSLPELKDILNDAGFTKIDIWWDADNGDDDYEICETAQNMEAWIAYIAAWK